MAYDTTKPYKDDVLGIIQNSWTGKNGYVTKKGPTIAFHKYAHLIDGYVDLLHTDGIGTKGVYYWHLFKKKKNWAFYNAAHDAIMMNLNDLLMSRARPCCLQNHIFIPKDNPEFIKHLVYNITSICMSKGVCVTGGETAIHNNIKGVDISATVSAIIRDEDIVDNRFKEGEFLIGFKSSGLHSNGFTRVRELFPIKDIEKSSKHDPEYFFQTLLAETEDYFRFSSHEMACYGSFHHITGGAFTKLKPFLDMDLDIELNSMPKINEMNENASFIYDRIWKTGELTSEEMYKTFNCGIGMVASVSESTLKRFGSILGRPIGVVKRGKGRVILKSAFDKKKVEY